MMQIYVKIEFKIHNLRLFNKNVAAAIQYEQLNFDVIPK